MYRYVIISDIMVLAAPVHARLFIDWVGHVSSCIVVTGSCKEHMYTPHFYYF